jgi:hypothetical protein
MVTTYESFVNEQNLLELSEGVMPKMGLNSFSNMFGQLFESEDDGTVEKAHVVYELGLLYESRKDWFEDDKQIYMLESGEHNILFKNNSLFIISSPTWKALNEWGWDVFSKAWDTVKKSAQWVVDKTVQVAKEGWAIISKGAQKVWEFAKRIWAAITSFAKENVLTCVAMLLQILSGVVSFIPAAGQIAGPILLMLAGGIEIYEGGEKMKEAWEKFHEMEMTKAQKVKEALTEGLPLAVAGSISLVMGLNDIITAPKAAIPGAGATSTAVRGAAKAWEKTFVGSAMRDLDHLIIGAVGKNVSKIGANMVGPVNKFMEKGGSALAATTMTFICHKVGSGVLGSIFDTILKGMGAVLKGLSSLLSLPTKISEVIGKIVEAADSIVAKILVFPLKALVGPAMKFLGKFIDNYIRPFIDKASNFLIGLSKSGEALEKATEQSKIQAPKPLTDGSIRKIKPKPVETSKDDLKKIKSLPKVKHKSKLMSKPVSKGEVKDSVKKEVPVKESANYIIRFGEFSMI